MAVLDVTFYSHSLSRVVQICVILPTDRPAFPGPDYDETKREFKTIYLLHGLTDNHTNWLYNTRIRRWAEENRIAVVMPSGDNSFYLDHPWNAVYYGEYIGKELVDFTRRSFPLSTKREDTVIAGLSMGGYGAMKNGLDYWETFGAIAALSGGYVVTEHLAEIPEHPRFVSETREFKQSTFGPDLEAAGRSNLNIKVLIEEKKKQGIDFPKIYMACGNRDPRLGANWETSDCLTANGVEHVFEVGPGGHEWDFWDTYILKVINWLQN